MDEYIRNRIRTTRMWRDEFKQSAEKMRTSAMPNAMYPPAGIGPEMWQMMIASHESMAESLQEELDKLERGEIDGQNPPV